MYRRYSADIYSLFSELGQYTYSFAVNTSSLPAYAGNKRLQPRAAKKNLLLSFGSQFNSLKNSFLFTIPYFQYFNIFDLSRNEILQRRQHPQKAKCAKRSQCETLCVFFFMFAIIVTFIILPIQNTFYPVYSVLRGTFIENIFIKGSKQRTSINHGTITILH